MICSTLLHGLRCVAQFATQVLKAGPSPQAHKPLIFSLNSLTLQVHLKLPRAMTVSQDATVIYYIKADKYTEVLKLLKFNINQLLSDKRT